MNTKEYSIEEFCDKHQACNKGREWALTYCKSMQEAWDTTYNPEWLVWIAIQPGVLSKKDLVRFILQAAKFAESALPIGVKKTLAILGKWVNREISTEEVQNIKKNLHSTYISCSSDVYGIINRTFQIVCWNNRFTDIWANLAICHLARLYKPYEAWINNVRWLRENVTPNFTYENPTHQTR